MNRNPHDSHTFAYQLTHCWIDRQTYGSPVYFDSFTVFMCLLSISIQKIWKGSLQPKLKKPVFGPLMHAVKCLHIR